jgi:orotidine-5'-phosphate decarboxylase
MAPQHPARLSSKKLPWRERLIVALDTPDAEEARKLVDQLGDMAGDYFDLLEWLHDKGKKVFVDLKFFDVPQTVGSAVR